MSTTVAPTAPGCQFASDNAAGICPEAWESLARANAGFATGYGDDEWTARACNLFRELFETDCEIFFVFNGTAANSLAIASQCQSYHSVVCHQLAHVETDECGAPEFFSNGTKVLLASGDMGKVAPDEVRRIATRRRDVHYPKARLLSLTQSTEVGTVYGVDEIGALSETSHGFGLHVHMDGARFANAVASLGASPKAVTWQAGVDVLCFGGTKNGTAVGEAVIFFDKKAAAEFEFRCKQAGQLASKMRLIAAPWVGLLESGAWLRHATHANTCARRLAQQLEPIPGAKVLFPVQANAVFVQLDPAVQQRLRDAGWRFYNFIAAGGVRFMCSWQTTDTDVDALAQAVRRAVDF